MGVSLHQLGAAIAALTMPALALAAPAGTLGSAVLPGGVEGLRRSLGDRAAMSPATVVVELTRRFYGATEAASERDPAFARFQAWLRDRTEPLPADSTGVVGDLVPLPATLEFWRESGLEHAGPHDVVRAVLRTRSAAFLYTALLSMDADTRAWLVDRPQLVRRWSDVDRGALLIAAPYLRVVSGRCELPGGADLAAVWADLVGADPGAPDACVEAVLRSHSGHLPFLLEIVATLSPEQQRAAFLSVRLKPDATARATQRVRLKPDTTAARALLAAVRQLSGAWRPGERPFSRPSPDPALMLAQIGADDRGGLALPGGRRFWEFVLADDDPRVAGEAARAAWNEPGPVTAAWLVGRLAQTPTDEQVDVYHQVLFAARLLADEPASEAAAVASAIRAHATFTPLMRLLERLQVGDAATLARVARQADALTRVGQDWQSRARLVQWQGMLALLDRVAHHGVLTTSERAAAIDALTAPPTLPTLRPWRGWLAAIVPGLPEDGDLAARPVERALLGWLAASPVSARPVVWEGTSYVLDLGAAEHDRLARVRARDSRPLLDAAVRLEAWLGAAAPRRASDALQLLTATAAAAGLDRPIEPDDEFGRVARDAARRARRQLAGAGGREVPPGVLAGFGEIADAMAALALAELAYAANMGWAEDLPLTAAAASRRHVFVATHGPRRHRFWQAPAISAERRLPWHVSGSLLGLDVALAPVAMRRLSLRPPAEMPLLNTGDRATLVATAAVLTPHRFGDEAQRTVTGFVHDALDQVENVRDRTELLRLAGLAGLSSRRAAAAEWLLAHDREALSGFFTMTELVRLGAAGAPPALLDDWGNYELPLSGRSGAGRFPKLPVERYGGRARRLLAVALPELQVTLAIRLAELKLPATLVPAVMASATLDVVNTTASRFADDWQAIVDRVRAVDGRAVERYLGLLTTSGPLRRLPENRR